MGYHYLKKMQLEIGSYQPMHAECDGHLATMMEVVLYKMPDNPPGCVGFWIIARLPLQLLLPFVRGPALKHSLCQSPGGLKPCDQLSGATSWHAWAIPCHETCHFLASLM